MKYVGFYEMDQKDKYKVFEIDDKLDYEYSADPEKFKEMYGELVFGPYFLGLEPKGMVVFEITDPKQMINMERAFWPYKRWRFVPLLDVGMVKEIYKLGKSE